LTRRSLLRGLAVTIAAPAMAELMSACGNQLYTSGDLVLAAPTHPVRWPLSTTHRAVEPGRTPQPGSTLRLYCYADYIGPAVMKAFEKKYGVKIVLSTFNDTDEAITKIATGSVAYDIYFPSYDQIGKMVTADLLRPLSHSYIPNIAKLWPQFEDPWYDRGWRYSVPYTVYTTGIGWRTDLVDHDISAMANPYDVFWDRANRDNCAVIDDWHTTMAMVLLRNGINDVNTAKASQLDLVRSQLQSMQQATNPRVTITQYNDLPAGQYAMALMWSGDIVNAVYYLPKHVSPDVLRFWFPSDGRGMVDNDLMVVLAQGDNPVAAHFFINYLLDAKVAAQNFGYIGYQPPQNSINPAELVADGFLPKNLDTATVLPRFFVEGDRLLQLPAAADNAYHQIWQEFKAGG
jgi:spermidine/putrescine transport system substrate-binding protein